MLRPFERNGRGTWPRRVKALHPSPIDFTLKSVPTLSMAPSFAVGLGVAGPVLFNAAKQSIVLTEVGPIILVTGWRATAMIGAEIYNVAGDDIGKIEDKIITAKDTVPHAVVLVGGVLGMDPHHVVVAAASLELVGKKRILQAVTKVSLKALPNHTFAA